MIRRILFHNARHNQTMLKAVAEIATATNWTWAHDNLMHQFLGMTMLWDIIGMVLRLFLITSD
jgi:hypothetical protein